MIQLPAWRAGREPRHSEGGDGVQPRARKAHRRWPVAGLVLGCLLFGVNAGAGDRSDDDPGAIDQLLNITLRKHGFTGTVEQSLERRLGRKLDPRLAKVGRLLFFDPAANLHNDNSCASCHAPSHGFGDTLSIAIGVQSNNLVGPHRQGPRNQRRTPSLLNAAFYPALMWNGRFAAPSDNPFDNSMGFRFPEPEGTLKFPANDPLVRHLLIAQAHMPPTELNEAAGFTGIRSGIDPRYYQFDDGKGVRVPDPLAGGFRNDPIRAAFAQRLNAVPQYVAAFGDIFHEVRAGAPIDMVMFGRAIAEFEFTLVRANAPIDRFARGNSAAMTTQEKRGALLFFGKANCAACHAVGGKSNEMFSDFQMHNIGVPQIAPYFGVGRGNTIFDGPGEDEDFGLGQVTGLLQDRYKFRSSPLRNAALQPAFFHNGSFTVLEHAIRHHLDVLASLTRYSAAREAVAADLGGRLAPIGNVSASLDALVALPGRLDEQEINDLNRFVRNGLLDERALPAPLCKLVPAALPSGAPLPKFESCP
jgi:cytochrome c peroxidase